jgi:hypothetical protein
VVEAATVSYRFLIQGAGAGPLRARQASAHPRSRSTRANCAPPARPRAGSWRLRGGSSLLTHRSVPASLLSTGPSACHGRPDRRTLTVTRTYIRLRRGRDEHDHAAYYTDDPTPPGSRDALGDPGSPRARATPRLSPGCPADSGARVWHRPPTAHGQLMLRNYPTRLGVRLSTATPHELASDITVGRAVELD